jgi:hypothetical protein
MGTMNTAHKGILNFTPLDKIKYCDNIYDI